MYFGCFGGFRRFAAPVAGCLSFWPRRFLSPVPAVPNIMQIALDPKPQSPKRAFVPGITCHDLGLKAKKFTGYFTDFWVSLGFEMRLNRASDFQGLEVVKRT